MDTQTHLSSQLIVGELVARWSRKSPESEALVCGEKRFTYRELNQRVNRLANGLASLGIGKGDKVALLFTNGTEIVECYFAVAKLGAVVVPLNFRLVGRELVYQLGQSDSRMLIFGAAFRDIVQSVRDELPGVSEYLCAGSSDSNDFPDYETFLTSRADAEPMIAVNDDDPFCIMYTSGTTGRPKGAVLTHKNFLVNALITSMEVQGSPVERWLCIAPLFHAAAASAMVKTVLNSGAIIISDQFEPEEVLRFIETEKITYLFMVPAMWIMLLEHPDIGSFDTSSLKRALTGASVMPSEIKRKILQHFPNARLSDSFGQTEMSPVTTILKPDDIICKQGSVGKPIATVEARIVDPFDKDVSPGDVGEIIYRGPTMMKEYYNNPEATAESMRGGWFHSGDLVRADEEGFIYIVGRSKDMIISGGENIYAVEVEEVLYTHPAILEAAVIGVPDPRWEEAVKAVVVLRPGFEATEEEIIEHCRKNMASYKKPKSVDFVDELPKNTTGKILKFKLRERFSA